MRLLPLVVLLGAAPLPAQQSLVSRTLDSATAVRLRLVDGPSVQGVLLAPLTPGARSILFAPPAYRLCNVPGVTCRLEVPVADVWDVEVRRGSRAGRGALFGLLAGTVAGFALGTWMDRPQCRVPGVPDDYDAPWAPGSCRSRTNGVVVAVAALVGGGLGAGLGALFGRGSPAWEPAP